MGDGDVYAVEMKKREGEKGEEERRRGRRKKDVP